MKLMQHCWKIDSIYSSFNRGTRTFTGYIPGLREITVILHSEDYVGYVFGHIKPNELKMIDLKIISSDKVFENEEDGAAILQIELDKFANYDDTRDYWATFET